MSNLPVAFVDTAVPPVLTGDLLAAYDMFSDNMLTGFGSGFNRIRPGKMDFTLIEGGAERKVENGAVVGVCLGISPCDFCTWYEKSYTPGQEPEQPDLVWNWPDHSKFPAALPAHLHKKVNRKGEPFWDFRIARRSVWALISRGANGQFELNLDNLYIFDITSASLFGKSDPSIGSYKWSGLIQLCNRMSRPPQFRCSPAMFATKIMIDANATVSGVVVFAPMMTSDASSFVYLDTPTFTEVVKTMQSGTVQEMLQVREDLVYPKPGTAAPQQMQPVAQPVQPVQPVAQPAPIAPQPAPAGARDLLGEAAQILGTAQQAAPKATVNEAVRAVASEAIDSLKDIPF